MDLEEVVRDYLPQIVHLSLGTCRDGRPWVSEVHFAYDDDLNLYFRSLTDRRHSKEIAANPYVAGDIIKQHAVGEPVLGIYFEGFAEKLGAGPAQETAARVIRERLQATADILKEAQRPDGHQFYKIRVSSFYIFGNLEGQSNAKHELVWDGESQ